MPVLTLRGMDAPLASALREEAQRRGLSMNALVLELVRQGLGLAERRRRHHDLDTLAGTWSSNEVAEFLQNTSDFETIEESLWR